MATKKNGTLDPKTWLKKKGLKQADLARRAGLSSGNLSSILAGRVSARAAGLKRIFFASDGEITPNDIFRVGEWLAELHESD